MQFYLQIVECPRHYIPFLPQASINKVSESFFNKYIDKYSSHPNTKVKASNNHKVFQYCTMCSQPTEIQ